MLRVRCVWRNTIYLLFSQLNRHAEVSHQLTKLEFSTISRPACESFLSDLPSLFLFFFFFPFKKRVKMARGQRYMASITDFTARRDFLTPASHFLPFEKCAALPNARPIGSNTSRIYLPPECKTIGTPMAVTAPPLITAIMTDDVNVTEAHLSALMRLFHFMRK